MSKTGLRAFWASGGEYYGAVVLTLTDEDVAQLERLRERALEIFNAPDAPDYVAWMFSGRAYDPKPGEVLDALLDASGYSAVEIDEVPDSWELLSSEMERATFSRFRGTEVDLTWVIGESDHEYFVNMELVKAAPAGGPEEKGHGEET